MVQHMWTRAIWVLAALSLALAGYSWQGRPALDD